MTRQHLEFTAEQAELILKRAGEVAVQRAHDSWALGIVDPMTLKAGVGSEERCADLIDYMIRSDEGLGWGGRAEYRFNGDAFQWCGAFAAYCQPYIALELRVMYWSSTDRLNAYAQHKLLFGNSRERALAAKYPKSVSKGFEEATGMPWTPAYARQFGEFNEASRMPAIGMRPGDICLFGGAPNPHREDANYRPFGQHVTLLADKPRLRDPDSWTTTLFEGNATGEIPGRPETRQKPVQGVINMQRPIGLRPSDSRDKYHLRRWMRPSFFDIDLDLYEKHVGALP